MTVGLPGPLALLGRRLTLSWSSSARQLLPLRSRLLLEMMQTMTKTHKIKTMNKKQLRQIKKTAINAQTGNLELVSPWKK